MINGTTIKITVEDMARQTDRAPWLVARALANLIEMGMLAVEDGTPADAIADLRALAGSYAHE